MTRKKLSSNLSHRQRASLKAPSEFVRSCLLTRNLDPGGRNIPVEMEDPFTRMCQNFFSFLSHTQQRGYVIATTQALSFSFFPPFSTTVVCVCSTVLLEFPNHPQEFPNQPTPMCTEGWECDLGFWGWKFFWGAFSWCF